MIYLTGTLVEVRADHLLYSSSMHVKVFFLEPAQAISSFRSLNSNLPPFSGTGT